MRLGMKRLAVVGALGVTSAALAVSPAFAKSDISIQATPHTAHVGHVVKVHGQGDDDAERYTVLVIQERSGKPGHGATGTPSRGASTAMRAPTSRPRTRASCSSVQCCTTPTRRPAREDGSASPRQ